MPDNHAYKEIMRDYDRLRQAAEHMKNKRKAEVYAALPRLGEIDNELSMAGIALSKAILAGRYEDETIAALQQQNEALQEEKAQILKTSGYPSDYLTNVYQCAKCSDTGFIGNKKCTCLSQKLIDKYYEQSNLKSIVEQENFDTFDFRYYAQEPDPAEGISPRDKIKAIFQTCLEFVSSFNKSFTNLLFYGKPGLGKTFLCNCIAKEILDKGNTVLYVSASQLFKTIETARFNRDELDEPSEQINLFFTVDLLVIDDLGTEFSTLVTQSELFNIINTRILEKRPTIISTNLAPKDFESQYSDRIISRFMGDYKFCKFLGEDIRALKKYAFKNN